MCVFECVCLNVSVHVGWFGVFKRLQDMRLCMQAMLLVYGQGVMTCRQHLGPHKQGLES